MGDAEFWVAEADRYMAECEEARSSVRASEFASRMNVTPARLAILFRASVGSGVKDYFSSRQIERAQELLRTTGHSTALIAMTTGFGTPRSFYRAFRRCTGMSPTEYREKMSLA
jgi:two-component system response regulator YesN